MSETVQLFITCIIDTLYPQIGHSVVRVLEHAGCHVAFPPRQTCCGQPAFNAGLRPEARKLAQHTIQTFETEPGMIVIPSGSCAAMIRHSYLELFDGNAEWSSRSKSLAERTFEFSEFLVDYLGVVDLGARFPCKATYHASCHLLRGMGINRQPRRLLQAVADLELIELPGAEECCGFGGVFSVEFPNISGAMLERKIANIETTQADVVVSCDAGCMTNINGGLHRGSLHHPGKIPSVMHLAQVLDNARVGGNRKNYAG